MEARIVEHELFERVAQSFVLVGVGRVDAGKDHRLDVTIARKELAGRVRGIENRVAHARVAHFPQAGDDVADLPGLELVGAALAQLEVADLVHGIYVARMRAEGDLHPGPEGAVYDANARDGPAVPVEIR